MISSGPHHASARIGAGVAIAMTALVLASCSSAPTGTRSPSSAPVDGQGTAAASPPAPRPTEVNPPGDVPDSQAYVAFTPASGVFTVKVPEGWSRGGAGSTTTFVDKLNSITLTQKATASAPTSQSVTTTDVTSLAATEPKFSLGKVTPFTRPGGSGVLVTYLRDSPPNAVTGSVVRDAVERYTFWKNGVAVTVSLASPQGADNVDPWNNVTRSFRWLK